MLEENERTRQQFEEIEGYPKPPLISIPDRETMSDPSAFRIKSNLLSRLLLRSAFTAAGLYSFRDKLPELLENDLRYSDFRGAILYAPAVVATLTITDDQRNPTPFERAASLLVAAYDVHRKIHNAEFEPDRLGDHVLEMGHYPNFFSTSLVVGEKGGENYKSSLTDKVAVVVKGIYFILETGPMLTSPSVSAIARTLEEISREAEQLADAQGPGLLTAASNPVQIKYFSRLKEDPASRDSLERLKHTFLTLCLDLDHEPESYELATRLAHTDNPSNRRYHASLQIVVFGNSKAALVCNFSCNLGGNGMSRMGVELQRNAAAIPLDREKETQPLEYHLLSFRITPGMNEKAVEDINKLRYDEEATFYIKGIGRDLFSELGIKPVEAFVVALQMTSMKLVQRNAHIFQFLSQTRYCCMDVTTAVVSTGEVNRAARYFLNGEGSSEEALSLLEAAADSQKKVSSRERHSLQPISLIQLLFNHRRGLRKVVALVSLNIMFFFFILTGMLKRIPREILISHPVPYPEIPVFGRPGARLPYVRYFGLHYLIREDRTDITVMPGTKWGFTNRRLTDEIESSLKRIVEVVRKETSKVK